LIDPVEPSIFGCGPQQVQATPFLPIVQLSEHTSPASRLCWVLLRYFRSRSLLDPAGFVITRLTTPRTWLLGEVRQMRNAGNSCDTTCEAVAALILEPSVFKQDTLTVVNTGAFANVT
jgi:hypothetical protein